MDFRFTYLFMTVNKNLAHLSPLRTCGCMLIINTSTQVNISGRQYSFKKKSQDRWMQSSTSSNIRIVLWTTSGRIKLKSNKLTMWIRKFLARFFLTIASPCSLTKVQQASGIWQSAMKLQRQEDNVQTPDNTGNSLSILMQGYC